MTSRAPLHVVRPVALSDLDGLGDLAESLGPGMTTLPADRDTLAEKIERSVGSFGGTAERAKAQYLLVLEGEGGRVLGTSALYPHVGMPFGFFSYKRLRQVQRSAAVSASVDFEMLALANDYTGTTEVGTLAVRPELKGTGAGRLLARARYMLAAVSPDLFAPLFMAEMRGWQDQRGHNPFWDAVGARFFNMDFAAADRLSAVRGSDFIGEMLPRHPIYIDLLPDDAREVIGRPHRDSAPAMAMLSAEGFRYEGYVDVFDAGPQVHCQRDEIATVRQSRSGSWSGTLQGEAADYLVSTNALEGFRVLQTSARPNGTEIILSTAAASAIGAEAGQALRWAPSRVEPL